jgi:hypothetical protein
MISYAAHASQFIIRHGALFQNCQILPHLVNGSGPGHAHIDGDNTTCS